MQIDAFDQKLLEALQKDGRLTNNELAERVGLSASQCSRRRTRLEDEGIIRGYRADIDPIQLGLQFIVIITVNLSTHNRDNARRFAEMVAQLPEILEAYSLTGEMDYHIKLATKDLVSLSRFVNDVLLPHASVMHVKSAIVLDVLKDFGGVPIRS